MKPTAVEVTSEDLLAAKQARWLKYFIHGSLGADGYYSGGAWEVIEKETYVHNWHVDLLADELQKTLLHEGPQNLLINVPPGTMKSLIVSVFAPAWMWINNPSWSGIFASGNGEISTRDAMRTRQLLGSDWYRNRFKIRWGFDPNQDAKTLFKNTEGGYYLATSVGSDITGARASAIFIDDPIDARDAPSAIKRQAANYWLDNAYANRLNVPTTGTRVIIMQRLHESDMSGHVLQQGGYHHICLPMHYERNHPNVYPLDPRREEGELLFPRRFPQTPVLDYEFTRLQAVGYAGQMQQRPTTAGGELFKIADWRFYRLREEDPPVQKRPRGCYDGPSVVLPAELMQVDTSWDCAFKDKVTSDYVAGGVWGKWKANSYLLARFKKKTGFFGTLNAIKMFASMRFGTRKGGKRPRRHFIEGKANGSAIVQTLKDEIAGVKEIDPQGGKFSRAEAGSFQVASGNVFLLDGAPYLEEYIGEHAVFPNGRNDDEVDQTSQYLVETADSKISFAARFTEAVKEHPQTLGLDKRSIQQFRARKYLGVWLA